jgi:outer membrane protein OmpA-like peptidoglycan-associated protein
MKSFLMLVVAATVASTAFSNHASAQSVCPDDFSAFAGTTDKLSCVCTAAATQIGFVWGMDVYTGDSGICRAAVHAGVIGRQGGAVTVTPEPGRKIYAGVTRNGIASGNFGQYESSFRFVGPSSAATPTASPGSGVAVCPDDFLSFVNGADPLTCSCSAEAAANGSVWGMDVYTGDSGVCRAAVHAGVIGRQGGQVTVIPEPGRKVYPGVTRNGVASGNFGGYDSSFRFAGAPAASAPVPAAPARTEVSICPDDFLAFADTKETLTCTCSVAATANGSVWGMDVYTGDSGVCRAAQHAGVIGRQGGQVTVIPEPARNAYAGITRNGISSANFGHYDSSFRFAQPAKPVLNGNVPVQQPIASTLRQTGEAQLYIRFRFSSAEIEPDAAPVLEELLATLRGDPALRLALIGHTDAVGSPDANLTLSARRAGAVGSWLIGRQIAPERLHVEGRGLTQPIADNATEMGRAINRRVQIRRIQ